MNLIWQAHNQHICQTGGEAVGITGHEWKSSFKPSNHVSENVYIKTLHKMGNNDALHRKEQWGPDHVCVLNIAM